MTRRELDFRNGKFQGYANKNNLNGFGFLLDENYTFIASNWNNNIINGPTFVIFEDSTMMYGSLKDNR